MIAKTQRLIEENYASSRSSNEDNDYQDNENEGSENAPEDSGFISEDGCEERIVNESSLNQSNQNEDDDLDEPMFVEEGEEKFFTQPCEQEMILIMTARSESAIDEGLEDEIEGISKCKAINSSFINLKRNNLLNAFGKQF